MVKGISRQVIVVHSPDPKLFEQAIFILKDKIKAVEDYNVLEEANHIIYQYVSQSNNYAPRPVKKKRRFFGRGKHQA